MKITFHYVRHGETLFNVLGRMQGWCDSPLTEHGIQQAQEAHDRLLSVPLTRAFSSTSERCIDTADIILKDRNVPLITTKGLKEVNFGIWEGEKVSLLMPQLIKHRETEDYKDVQGESKDEVYQRIRTSFNDIIHACNDGDGVLIVSHGAFFLMMTEELFHISKSDLINAIRWKKSSKGNPVANGYVADFVFEDGSYRFTRIKGIEHIENLHRSL